MSQEIHSGKHTSMNWPRAGTLLCLLTLGVVLVPVIYNVGYGQRLAGHTPSSRIVNVRADQLEPLLTALAEEGEDAVAPTTHSRVEVPDLASPRNNSGLQVKTDILRLQKELVQLGYHNGSLSGALDAQTRRAVRALQEDRGLPVTGLIDQRFADALAFALRIEEATEHTASISRQTPSGTVRQVQTALTLLGYDAGPIDGAVGAKTTAAIVGFQRRAGLQASGRIDSNLLRKLGISAQDNKSQ